MIWHKTEAEEYHFDADWLEPGAGGVWYDAHVKWDGCIEFRRYFNEPRDLQTDKPTDMVDHIHICDLDKMIEQLNQLKGKAKEHFGEEWPL